MAMLVEILEITSELSELKKETQVSGGALPGVGKVETSVL